VKRGVITTSELEEDPRETDEGGARKTVFKLGSRSSAAVGDEDDGNDSS
jgi:hypothetical protein